LTETDVDRQLTTNFSAFCGIPSIAFENTSVQLSLPASTAHASSKPSGYAQSLPPFSARLSARREACSARLPSENNATFEGRAISTGGGGVLSPATGDGSRISFPDTHSFDRSSEQYLNLGPDPIALCLGMVNIVAAFDATTPTNTRFGTNILSAIQPVVVSRALHGVYARLVDSVRVVRHSDEHVISVG
jgi:hypothetical protein